MHRIQSSAAALITGDLPQSGVLEQGDARRMRVSGRPGSRGRRKEKQIHLQRLKLCINMKLESPPFLNGIRPKDQFRKVSTPDRPRLPSALSPT